MTRALVTRRGMRGMSLVELLVAVSLGLLVIAGVGQIYSAAKRSYDLQTSLARMQDVGRYAIDTLTQDIRRAGYWGLTNMGDAGTTLTGHVPPNGNCAGDSTWGRMIGRRLFGLDGDAAPYACIGTHKGDILVVRYADQRGITTFKNNYLYLRSAPYQASIVWGDPNAPSAAPSGEVELTNAVPAGPFSDHQLVAHAYYVQNSTTATCNEEPIPALVREEIEENGAPKRNELIIGVENIQFQFGIDTPATDATRSVNQYLNAHEVTNWNDVVAIRLWVLVRDECPDPAYTNTITYKMGNEEFTPNNHHRRQLYSTTVALRNRYR